MVRLILRLLSPDAKKRLQARFPRLQALQVLFPLRYQSSLLNLLGMPCIALLRCSSFFWVCCGDVSSSSDARPGGHEYRVVDEKYLISDLNYIWQHVKGP